MFLKRLGLWLIALMKGIELNVYVLKIEHKHGIDIHIYRKLETANENLFAYVKEYWDDFDLGEMPKDRVDAIEEYFNRTDEYYDLFVTTVQ